MDMSKYLLNIKNDKNQFLVPIIGSCVTMNNNLYKELSSSIYCTNIQSEYIPRISLEYGNKEFILLNLPSINTLYDLPKDKLITRDFLCFSNPDIILLLCSEDTLENDLSLLFQIMDLGIDIILYIKLNANNKNTLNKELLEVELGIPVIFESLDTENTFSNLYDTLTNISNKKLNYNKHILYECNIENVVSCFESQLEKAIKNINPRWLALRIIDNDKSFFESMHYYMDESCITKLNTIKKNFPKTLDAKKVRDNFYSRNYNHSIYIKNKVYSNETDNNTVNKKYIFNSKHALVLVSILIWLALIIVVLCRIY